MFRSSHRYVAKNSVPCKPRFAPRLEALESRYAPACSFNPSNGILYGGAGDTVLLNYVPWSDGQDIYCNFQYVGTNYSTLYFYTEPQSTFLEIDTTLSTSAGSYYVDYSGASFGNTIFFMNWKPADVAFILGNAANTVTVGSGNPNTTVVGWSQSQPAKVFYSEDSGTEYFNITQNEIHPISSAGDVDFYNVNEITFFGDQSDTHLTVKNTAGSLGTMPFIYINDFGGLDTLTLDVSAQSANEKYFFDEVRMYMPDYLKNIVWYNGIEKITLKAGSGNDNVTIGNNTLAGLPDLTIDGGGGVNHLTADNSSAGEWYTIDHGILGTATSATVANYSNIAHLYLETAVGNDTVYIGWGSGMLAGLPIVHVLDPSAADSDVLYLFNGNSSANTVYDVNITVPAAGQVSAMGVHTTTFSFLELIGIYAGNGNNTIDVAKANGQLSPMGLVIGAGGGTDTLNIYDKYNPSAATYTVASLDSGMGSVDVNTPSFAADFVSVDEVNLYRSLILGSTVNTNGYNPAHYVLNVFPAKDDTGGAPPDEDPINPLVQPPMPAPPGPSGDEKPLVRRKLATMPVGRRSVPLTPDADEWLAETLQIRRS